MRWLKRVLSPRRLASLPNSKSRQKHPISPLSPVPTIRFPAKGGPPRGDSSTRPANRSPVWKRHGTPGSPKHRALLRIYAFFFFGGTMASFAALATRNFTTFFAAILMAWPVAGFRPIRALRSTRTSRPIPGSTNKPFFLTSATAVWASVSNRLFASFLVIPHLSARVGRSAFAS